MAREGMVHALEAIHRLLKPGGCLLDIRPLPQAPLVKIVQSGYLLTAKGAKSAKFSGFLGVLRVLCGKALERLSSYQSGKVTFTGPVPALNEEDVRQAEAALAQVVQRRLFVVERSGVFDFLVYASSVAELRNFLEEANAFQDSPPDEAATAAQVKLAARLEEALQAAGEGAEVVYQERARITRLVQQPGLVPPPASG